MFKFEKVTKGAKTPKGEKQTPKGAAKTPKGAEGGKTPKGAKTPGGEGAKTPKGAKTPGGEGGKTPKSAKTPGGEGGVPDKSKKTPKQQGVPIQNGVSSWLTHGKLQVLFHKLSLISFLNVSFAVKVFVVVCLSITLTYDLFAFQKTPKSGTPAAKDQG